MNRISTHILDTSRGLPAAGIPVRLYEGDRQIGAHTSDAGGRCQNLLPDGHALSPGVYRILFDIALYFPDGLYPEVAISFKVSACSTHYHIPLLISPFGYVTYRGS